MSKVIMSFHSNGDLEIKDSKIIKSGINNNYKFGKNDITLPNVYENSKANYFTNGGLYIKGKLLGVEDEYIFFDDFNGNDNDSLKSNWNVLSGSFNIIDNKAKPTNLSSTNNIAITDIEHSDNIKLSLGLISTFASESLLFRFKDSANYVQAMFENGDVYLKVRRTNTNYTIQRSTLGTTLEEEHKMEVELRGNNIKVYIDDVLKIDSFCDDFIEVTNIGLKAWTNSNKIGVFDNLKVTKLI